MKRTFFLMVSALLIGCDHSGDQFTPASELQGAWTLYEQGYSPGSGYFITPVSEVPPRVMVFSGENQFSSTLQGLFDHKFYSITNNVQSGMWELWLYTEEPNPLEPDPSRLMYNFEFQDGKLKLYPVFPSRCIEGCHLGFKR